MQEHLIELALSFITTMQAHDSKVSLKKKVKLV